MVAAIVAFAIAIISLLVIIWQSNMWLSAKIFFTSTIAWWLIVKFDSVWT